MGQAESQPAALAHAVKTGVAFHVLRVAERSPAASAGIDPFFDFVCGINGKPLGEDIDALTDALERNEGRKIYVQIYSTKRKELRDVSLVPSRTWAVSDSPQEPSVQPSLLGLSLRLCNPQHALEQVWHVLEILEGSPAQSAGLVPFGDWIVGYAGGVLRGEGDFYDVVENHVDKPLRLFVYNADYDVTREAILVPNRNWGGEGLLGCGVGYGLLHRISKPQDRTRLPPEVEEDDEEDVTRAESREPAAGVGRPQAAGPPSAYRPPPPPTQQPHQQAVPPPPRKMNGSVNGGYEEDLRQTSGGRYTHTVSPPPPPRRVANVNSARRQPNYPDYDDDGYDEAGYEGEFAASAGVEVVPVGGDDDYSGFAVPADAYATAGQMSIAKGSGGGGYVPPPPVQRPQSEIINEEDE